MKTRLQRILSVLCALALLTGCLAVAAFAEEAPEDVSRVITVEFDDENDYEGLRPASVTMSIAGQSVTLSEANGWVGEATVPEDAAWTIQAVPGYSASESGSDVKTVTYRHTVAKTFLTASVSWQDDGNAGGKRPASVRLSLLADGQVFRAPVTVSAANGWTASWDNLPVNKEGTTTPLSYSIAQADPVEGDVTVVNGATVTNTLQTGALNLQIAAAAPNGEDVSGLSVTVTGPDPKMPMTFTLGSTGGSVDIGSVIPGAYVVQVTNADSIVPDYGIAAGSKVGDAVYVKAGEGQTLSVSTSWAELEEDEGNTDPMAEVGGLVFEIFGPDPSLPKTVTSAEFSGGSYTLNNLVPGDYAVVERNPEGLVRAYSLTSDSVTGITVTVTSDGAVAALLNRYVPAPTPEPDAELIDIPVGQIWNDTNNKDGNRPASVTFNLYANGVLNDSAVLSEDTGWNFTFTEKPRYDENNEEIVYTINEEPVAWYTPEINGWFITNNYQPEVTTASVTKVWDDNNNEQKIRPTSIAVTLLPVGEVYVLDESNGWNIVKNDLPVLINGEPVTYSWTEQEVVGYTRQPDIVDGSATVLTNRVVQMPVVPANEPQPKMPTRGWVVFEEYETALGGDIIINHVGDCFD